MCLACIDTQKAEAFAGKVVDILNGGALSLMISIGHRAGLFDAMRATGPLTIAEIAKRAKLNERYVREWLGAMVTGEIVTVDPKTERYELPDEHAAFLTRAASPDNLAVTAQFISELGSVEDRILACFERGGGIPYSGYSRFHEIMAEDSYQSVVSGLDDRVIPLIDGLDTRLEKGISVLDVGCGRGLALMTLAARYPRSQFLGYDFSDDAIAFAHEETQRRGLTNLRFEVRDVSRMHERLEYDLITAFDAIHDQARPADVLDGIYRALKPRGTFLMQDIKGSSSHHGNIGHPLGPILYTISALHCMSVSLAAGGAGLGAMWGREVAESMLANAGFNKIEIHELDHDKMNYWYIANR